MDFGQETILAKEPEIVVASQPGGQIMGHQFPGAASPDNIEDAIENFPVRIDAGASVAPVFAVDGGEEGFEQGPLSVGEIG